MARKHLLEEKRQELCEELRKWARENKLLKPGEFLYLTITIAHLNTAVVAATTDAAPISSPSEYDYKTTWILDETDWQLLLSNTWTNDIHKAMIELLKTCNNEPISREDFERQLGFKWHRGFTKSISAAMGRNNAFLRTSDKMRSYSSFRFAQIDSRMVPFSQRRIRIEKVIHTPLS